MRPRRPAASSKCSAPATSSPRLDGWKSAHRNVASWCGVSPPIERRWSKACRSSFSGLRDDAESRARSGRTECPGRAARTQDRRPGRVAARIHEGIEALNGCGEIMALNVAAARAVPQVSVIMGPCAGAAAYSPALTDWTIMVRGTGQMFLTGPEVVRAATGERVDPEELGGATLHTKESGVAHFETPTEEDGLGLVRQLLGYFPQNAGGELPERLPASPLPARVEALPDVVPASARATYDMRDVIGGIVDASVMLEVMAPTAPSLLTGFARIEGSPVGIVANQPRRRGGILDAATAVKGARFVSFCGRFGILIVTLVDVPGFMPGSAEEKRAVITHGASLLAAYVEADSPKLTVIVRKAYGGAYIALGSRALGADMSWAWPHAEIAVMGPEAAVG